MERVRLLVARAAPTDEHVLICGARGVGKSFLARTIHKLSARTGPLVIVNCDAPEDPLTFDLFGHERWHRGIPTEKVGALEVARGGTVFLKDVDKLGLPQQAMLLYAIERKVVRVPGGSNPRPIDVRIIASTHQDLAAARARRLFRADLLGRLSSVVIEIPALRERMDEIPALVDELLEELRRELGRETSPRLTRDATERLLRYQWAGNLGELRAVMRRALLLCDGAEISAGDLTIEMPAPPSKHGHAKTETADPTRKFELLENELADAGERQRFLEALSVPQMYAVVREYAGPGTRCSICDEPHQLVRMLFRGSNAFICDRCVGDAQTIAHSGTRQPDGSARADADSGPGRADVGCAFCGRSASEVDHLVGAEDSRMICGECLDFYDQVIGDRLSADWPRGKTFTFRAAYSSDKIDARIAGARGHLTRDHACRIVILVDDGKDVSARRLLDRTKASLADVADFWDPDLIVPGVGLTVIAHPRPTLRT